MKALTIWQPWASFIMAGAKKFEFRTWDYSKKFPNLVDQRIAIHAGARPMRRSEIDEILTRIDMEASSLDPAIVVPLCHRLLAANCKGVLPLASGLGTAIIGRPRNVNAIFKRPDSDRAHQHMFAWPLTDIQPFDHPQPARGFQGFWTYQEAA